MRTHESNFLGMRLIFITGVTTQIDAEVWYFPNHSSIHLLNGTMLLSSHLVAPVQEVPSLVELQNAHPPHHTLALTHSTSAFLSDTNWERCGELSLGVGLYTTRQGQTFPTENGESALKLHLLRSGRVWACPRPILERHSAKWATLQ